MLKSILHMFQSCSILRIPIRFLFLSASITIAACHITIICLLLSDALIFISIFPMQLYPGRRPLATYPLGSGLPNYVLPLPHCLAPSLANRSASMSSIDAKPLVPWLLPRRLPPAATLSLSIHSLTGCIRTLLRCKRRF